MDSVEFLDAVRARHGIPSDNKLAKHLGLPEPRISLIRTRTRKLDPAACIAVASALDVPAEYVLASVQAERAKRTEYRKIWERLAELAKSGAASLAAIAIMSPALLSAVDAGQCILCKTGRGYPKGPGDRRRPRPDRRRKLNVTRPHDDRRTAA
jgi:DNA-binding transcriptional regulator YdaS (Cro superfamily)